METETTSPVESLFDKLKDYLDTRINLLKLKAIDKSSGFASSLLTIIIVAILGIFCLVLINIGLALLIGECLGHYYLGFLIMAAVYILLAIIIYKCRNKWLKNPIASLMIKSLLD